jgi:hypothetical protein
MRDRIFAVIASVKSPTSARFLESKLRVSPVVKERDKPNYIEKSCLILILQA